MDEYPVTDELNLIVLLRERRASLWAEISRGLRQIDQLDRRLKQHQRTLTGGLMRDVQSLKNGSCGT